jgi:hypothetical protein
VDRLRRAEARWEQTLARHQGDRTVDEQPRSVKVTAPPGAVVVTWTGQAAPLDLDRPRASSGTAVFTRRGDALATGWLDAYRNQAPGITSSA